MSKEIKLVIRKHGRYSREFPIKKTLFGYSFVEEVQFQEIEIGITSEGIEIYNKNMELKKNIRFDEITLCKEINAAEYLKIPEHSFYYFWNDFDIIFIKFSNNEEAYIFFWSFWGGWQHKIQKNFYNIIQNNKNLLDSNRLKAEIESYIKGVENRIDELKKLIGKLNWAVLEEKGIANSDDAMLILQLMKTDPSISLTKMRTIIEKIVNKIYYRYFPEKNLNLAKKIKTLKQLDIIPPIIHTYFNTLRIIGNIGTHGTTEEGCYVKAIVPMFIEVIEWFIEEIIKKE